MKVIAGPNSEQLAQDIAAKLNLEILGLSYKYFTDGETYLKIEGNIEKEDVIIIQTTFPNQEKSLIELILLSKSLKDLGADKVIAIVPYLCYARADRTRIDGEVVSHSITMDILSSAGIDTLVTINVHNPEAFHETAENMEKYNLSALPAIVDYYREKTKSDWIVVGPDQGSKDDIEVLARELSLHSFVLEKHRDPLNHEVKFKEIEADLKSKSIILLDDVVTSGGTALKAMKILLDKNPSSLQFVVFHALAKNNVFNEIKEIGVRNILSVNTVAREDIEQIDISYLISKFIEEKFL
jgi:ribose-phosphate pyrophosphokinase